MELVREFRDAQVKLNCSRPTSPSACTFSHVKKTKNRMAPTLTLLRLYKPSSSVWLDEGPDLVRGLTVVSDWLNEIPVFTLKKKCHNLMFIVYVLSIIFVWEDHP